MTKLESFYPIEPNWTKLRAHTMPQKYLPRHTLTPVRPIYGLLTHYKKAVKKPLSAPNIGANFYIAKVQDWHSSKI